MPPRKATRRGGGAAGTAREVTFEVADDSMHGQARIFAVELVRAGAHNRLGHIEWDVALERAGGREGVEHEAGLRGAPRAELHELVGAGELGQLARPLSEDRALGARLVVLGELADALEQLRAARVVEVLRRQLLERAREPVEDVLGERALS